MPPPNNPLVMKAALVFKRDQRTFVNTLHFSKDSAWSDNDLLAMGAELLDWWVNSYRQAIPTEVSLQQIQLRVLDPSNPLAFDHTAGLPSAGLDGGLASPGNVTETLSWRTGLAGRKYRGRIYIPGVPEGAVGPDDRVTSTFASLLANIAQYFLNNVGIPNVHPVVFHLATNTFTRIISFVIENIVDSQRRRLPARGR